MNGTNSIIETPGIFTCPVECFASGAVRVLRINLNDEGRIFTVVKGERLIGRYAHIQNAVKAMDREEGLE